MDFSSCPTAVGLPRRTHRSVTSANSRSTRFNSVLRTAGIKNKKALSDEDRAYMNKPGDFLLSHTLARAVPSGLRGLTAVFGMGTGGSLSLWSPRSRGAGALAHWRAEYFDGWPFLFEGERPETHSESSAVLCAQ